MKAIYDNEIVEINIGQINYEDNSVNAIVNGKKNVMLWIYPYYEYEEDPLLFIPLPEIYDSQKIALISQYEEWYGNTNQSTTDWALEFEVFVRMLLDNHLIVNPKYLELDNDHFVELLEIMEPCKNPSCHDCDHHECFDCPTGMARIEVSSYEPPANDLDDLY